MSDQNTTVTVIKSTITYERLNLLLMSQQTLASTDLFKAFMRAQYWDHGIMQIHSVIITL